MLSRSRTQLLPKLRQPVLSTHCRNLCTMNTKDTNESERKEAAAMRQGRSAGTQDLSEEAFNQQFPPAVLSPDAKQKYAMFEVTCAALPKPRHLVRGDARASYHKDAAKPLQVQLSMSTIKGLKYNIIGGGRIVHNSKNKHIEVYGHSYGFPWKDGVYKNDLAASACEKSYPSYEVVYNNTEGLY